MRHRTGDTVINRADVGPTLLEAIASLGSGLCTLLAIGWKVSVIWISKFRMMSGQ